ncbi:MAG TPA: roadblock/LC7 domain-containing protein [Thermoleophilia bacterium]|nr:roadblock/LC7 domain-containing protein [Thermoleophilia bacterium]
MAADPIFDLMRSYLDTPGMEAAVLVSDQGLVINSAQREGSPLDIETISALVGDTLSAAQRFGREADVGRLDTMTIEFGELALLLAPFEQDVMLALIALPGTFALMSDMGA